MDDKFLKSVELQICGVSYLGGTKVLFVFDVYANWALSTSTWRFGSDFARVACFYSKSNFRGSVHLAEIFVVSH